MTGLAHRLLGLTAQTPIHAGAGSADDVIDLPIQREGHTDWPCIFGSSVKGALRAHAEATARHSDLLEQETVNVLFGPDTANASEYAGSLLITDARLALLPVRSLTGHFRWVTCPAILRRLASDRQRLGLTSGPNSVPEIPAGTALHCSGNEANTAHLYLEEFLFEVSQDAAADDWSQILAELMEPDDAKVLQEQLSIVDNDAFRHLCRAAIPVQPHIRLNSETKTVEPGALWYEENLPADSVLYVCISAQPPRAPSAQNLSAADLLTRFVDPLLEHQGWIQLGGNETTGMGWCRTQGIRDTRHD